MKKYDIYDKKEKSNKEAFEKLPTFYQDIIKEAQNTLQIAITQRYPKAIPTSGFRSISVNQKVGGVSDSLHLFGFARDFYCPTPILNTFRAFEVIPFPNLKHHYHVQYIRG